MGQCPGGSLPACHPETVTRAVSWIAAIAAMVLLAASCGGPVVNTGPLGNGGDSGGICVYLHPGAVLSYGVIGLRNTGSSEAIIQQVSLVKPQHLRLVASYVVPITGHLGYGVWDGYPPAPHQAGVEWARHTRAVGTHLPPTHAFEQANLVIVLKPTGPVGKALATDVFYLEGGQQYEMQNTYRFVLIHHQCPRNWVRKYPA
jgi:hypothetical protein